jgi:pimeloyl-ACP methyl ester carboxylesterase
MATAKANGIELEYDVLGDPDDPAMLLIMGLGAQLTDWPQEFCEQLAGRGYRVIRFDNRDSGLSGGLDELGVPDMAALRGGDTRSVPYRLADLAADAAGLLDALTIDKAHVVGVSLGGMIAQQLTIDFPDRVRSLCSIMSTTGDWSVGRSTPEATAVLQQRPATNRDDAIANALAVSRAIGSPGFPADPDEVLRRAAAKVDRAYRPAGTARQYAAILASPDRTGPLGRVTVPAVVIHGAEDPLIDVSGGRATAAAIPGAELVVVPGMGHDLPVDVWPQVIDAIDRTARR